MVNVRDVAKAALHADRDHPYRIEYVVSRETNHAERLRDFCFWVVVDVKDHDDITQ